MSLHIHVLGPNPQSQMLMAFWTEAFGKQLGADEVRRVEPCDDIMVLYKEVKRLASTSPCLLMKYPCFKRL